MCFPFDFNHFLNISLSLLLIAMLQTKEHTITKQPKPKKIKIKKQCRPESLLKSDQKQMCASLANAN